MNKKSVEEWLPCINAATLHVYCALGNCTFQNNIHDASSCDGTCDDVKVVTPITQSQGVASWAIGTWAHFLLTQQFHSVFY